MADKKISALTAATTPLVGTEVLPIVQSGSTVKVSVSNLTAGRAISSASITTDNFTLREDVNGIITLGRYSSGYPNVIIAPNSTATRIEIRSSAGNSQVEIAQATGNVTFVTGNLIQGTAAKGVNFTANTSAAGMTSQLLNWYEEGTWTPALRFGGGSTGMTGTFTGRYTRIGRVVYIYFDISLTAKGSSTGNATVTGLPFSTADFATGIADPTSALAGLVAGGAIPMGISGTTINLFQQTTTDRNLLTHANFTNTSILRASMCYGV